MKHHLAELFFKLYLWSCGTNRDEYYDWIEENILVNKYNLSKDYLRKLND